MYQNELIHVIIVLKHDVACIGDRRHNVATRISQCEGRCIVYDYTEYMDYTSLDVCCAKKAPKLSLAFKIKFIFGPRAFEIKFIYGLPALNHILTLLGDSLQWRHYGLDGVSNHQPYYCLLGVKRYTLVTIRYVPRYLVHDTIRFTIHFTIYNVPLSARKQTSSGLRAGAPRAACCYYLRCNDAQWWQHGRHHGAAWWSVFVLISLILLEYTVGYLSESPFRF